MDLWNACRDGMPDPDTWYGSVVTWMVVPMKDLNRGKDPAIGTQFEQSPAEEAELWSVLAGWTGGDAQLISDHSTQAEAEMAARVYAGLEFSSEWRLGKELLKKIFLEHTGHEWNVTPYRDNGDGALVGCERHENPTGFDAWIHLHQGDTAVTIEVGTYPGGDEAEEAAGIAIEWAREFYSKLVGRELGS